VAGSGRSDREHGKMSHYLYLYVSDPSDHGKAPPAGNDSFVPSANVLLRGASYGGFHTKTVF
jgi:hypothetical protein